MSSRERPGAGIAGRLDLAKLFRYAVVSVIVNALTFMGFIILIGQLGVPAYLANLSLITALVPLVFALNRRFVWRTHGHRWTCSEIAPFAVFSLSGVILTTLAVHAAADATLTWSTAGRTVAAEAANLAASGLLWIGQYAVVNRFVWALPVPIPSRP